MLRPFPSGSSQVNFIDQKTEPAVSFRALWQDAPLPWVSLRYLTSEVFTLAPDQAVGAGQRSAARCRRTDFRMVHSALKSIVTGAAGRPNIRPEQFLAGNCRQVTTENDCC
jgi:hypothetical protein